LFIELVDGTSPVPLQIVVKSTLSNFEDLKKTKRSYSFRISGKVIKSLGKGQ
jgi:asparaginyl-tRNA synthetase